MSRARLSDLFGRALDRAAEKAEQRLGRPISRNYLIEFHGMGSGKGSRLSVEETVDRLFVADDLYIRIIDVVAVCADSTATVMFVRPSGHNPVSFSETRYPDDLCPFTILEE